MSSRTRAPSSLSSPAAWGAVGRRPDPAAPQAQDPSLQRSRPEPQAHMSGFTVIAPDQIRRANIMKIAKKELEDLAKWKQQQRSRIIHTKPNKLGGNQSEAEARKKQQCQLLESKYQQKVKRGNCVTIQKEMEEAKFQTIKAIQREKNNKMEEKRRPQEKQKREVFNDQSPCKSSEFLSSLKSKVPTRSLRQTSPEFPIWAKNEVLKNTLRVQENQKLHKMKDEQYKKGELLELKRQWQEEERTKAHQREQRRINNAFLDLIQGKSQPSGLHPLEDFGNMN
ncbi:epithelial-stromal interaction protein 1 isoform X2 [Macrotis lagotis]|uniref:epithelial-stromal interaction protein 1 isoform X2 n=1 Tax=Macrotis lagotis TaxID=92651 RepID=UPI003D69A2CA